MINSMLQRHKEQLEKKLGEKVIVRKDLKVIDSEMAEADIMVGFGASLGAMEPEQVELFPRLKWIHADNVGVEGLPFDQLSKKQIIVTNTRGIQAPQICEQIFGMMIMFSRGLHVNYRNQLDSIWDNSYVLERLYGKTLCIAGTGYLGKELAKRVKAFGMKVVGIRKRSEVPEYFDRVMTLQNKLEALKEADYMALLLPLTPQTYHFIGEKEFFAMKRSAVLLNYSRGDIIDNEAMMSALKNNRIRGAGLDVFHKEPLPKDDPLWRMPNVIISPHNAGSVESGHDIRKLHVFMELYSAYKNGDAMRTRVDLIERY
ncbi:D-2-hydroxyacid dehydrogenase [Alkalihalobacillus oceani]|uniref:D-2-hydroxyacid dehydrogenase n=1 Tax=Halalkalibacter oceani TaxID=1653776 RepID=A0A9X2DLS2_9BACI|nr:D-2-hydroxyacid dehydrogenase [Halalkalibacter oceani]MCM3712480.1 D-2-hydroxyacid dehydrogenase [Halalkalibacter oceani]